MRSESYLKFHMSKLVKEKYVFFKHVFLQKKTRYQTKSLPMIILLNS
jgi:hypothetical protein